MNNEKPGLIRCIEIDVAALPENFPPTSLDWLRQLKGPTWIDIVGDNRQRTRVISTLLHGNEPSGVQALFQWIKAGRRPATNLSIFVGAVETALADPLFSHRMLPGERDLNRCFRPPFDSPQGQVAAQVIERIHQLQPECVVDIHNTSGSGPSFSVVVVRHPMSDLITRMFCRRMMVTDFRLGSLMEIDVGCPVVTIECGGALDEEAMRVGLVGLERLLHSASLTAESLAQNELEIMINPLRVELQPGITVAYSNQPVEDANITLSADLEFHNHGVTRPDHCLGWVGPKGLEMLQAKDATGEEQLYEFFREVQGWLYPVEPLRLFMVTTDAAIAQSDCLFYASLSQEDNA